VVSVLVESMYATSSVSVILTNVHHTLHYFQDIGEWPSFFMSTGEGVLYLMHSFEVYPKFRSAKFVLRKLETSFHGVVQSIFRYLEQFRRDHKCDRETGGI